MMTKACKVFLKYGGMAFFVISVFLALHNFNLKYIVNDLQVYIHRSQSGKQNVTAKNNESMYSCDHGSDCWKLQEYFKTSLDKSKPKAAVYILSRASDAKDLNTTLIKLEKNFLSKYSYPVIIFHQADFVPLLPGIRAATNLALFFQQVQFTNPTFLDPPAKGYECSGKDLGYNHMCRFHSKIVYDLPIMKNLEYYLRLDAHSYINQPVAYDFIKHMKDNNILYLYPCTRTDQLRCARYLWDAAELYIKVKHIEPKFFAKMSGLKMFYNNFEVARMDVFQGKAYQNYISYIDQLGGIFHHRWGDAPIKSIAVSIFVPENQTRHVYDISYSHRSEHLTRALKSKPGTNQC